MNNNSGILSKEAFIQDVHDGMMERRNNILELIKDQRIKSIYVLFKEKPDTEDIERIKYTIEVCKDKVNLHIRQIDWKAYECLKDEEPFKDPSMALIVGNNDAKFNLGLCHGSQATDGSYVVHTDTLFSQNRLSWFDRAWELAVEYKI